MHDHTSPPTWTEVRAPHPRVVRYNRCQERRNGCSQRAIRHDTGGSPA